MLAALIKVSRTLLTHQFNFAMLRTYSHSDSDKHASWANTHDQSVHYVFNPGDAVSLFNACRMEYRERQTELVLKYCPFCPKPHNNKPDNLYRLNVSKSNGLFLCFRCGAKGNWLTFKKNMFDSNGVTELERKIESVSLANQQYSEIEIIQKAYDRYIGLKNNLLPSTIKYLCGNDYKLGERGLKLEVLEKYKVGIGYEKFRNDNNEYVPFECVWFPMYCPSKKPITFEKEIEKLMAEVINTPQAVISKMKCRAIGKDNKSRQRIEPTGSRKVGFFGLNTIPSDSKSIIITEGEFDAMAVYQSTGLPTVSLPNGANHLPIEALSWFEKYEKIYLWMDNDEIGRKNSEKFAIKLGSNKTHIVDTSKLDLINPPKDANDALREGKNLNIYINSSKPMPMDKIVTFSDIKSDVINKLTNYSTSSGIPSTFFKWYNKKIKGFRKGELSIVTGGTGSGKTTFLSQLSVDFLQQGIPTLWGSFEIKNDVLASTMLLQYSKVDLTTKKDEILKFANDFEGLPLYFLKYFGATPLDELLVTLEYAIYAFDLGHVIIDNMQFLLSGQGKGFERFDIQDDFISKLRKLVSEKGVHITLVIHPKKVDEDMQDLTISSVFGSAKATQEADNIIILQNRHKYRHIDVRKNRFDGETGRAAIGFDKEIRSFIELTDEEIFELNTTSSNMKEIIIKRKFNPHVHGIASKGIKEHTSKSHHNTQGSSKNISDLTAKKEIIASKEQNQQVKPTIKENKIEKKPQEVAKTTANVPLQKEQAKPKLNSDPLKTKQAIPNKPENIKKVENVKPPQLQSKVEVLQSTSIKFQQHEEKQPTKQANKNNTVDPAKPINTQNSNANISKENMKINQINQIEDKGMPVIKREKEGVLVDDLIGYPSWATSDDLEVISSFIETPTGNAQQQSREPKKVQIEKASIKFGDADNQSMSEKEKRRLYKSLKDGGYLKKRGSAKSSASISSHSSSGSNSDS